MRKRLFLLGGHDLEMLAIKELLLSNQERVIDNSLSWENAALSSYTDIHFDDDCDIYGIELREDIPLPSSYHKIDHHNELSGHASSIEQVATILGIQLNRFQLLAAFNDKAYIPGMIQIGASKEEILLIRRLDRKAQGITEEEERLAEKSIAEKLRKEADIIIVESYTGRFSPICDLLYPYKHLIVYTEHELMYYGEDSHLLVTEFAKEIESGKMFYGGSENGYVGTVQNEYSLSTLIGFIERIKNIYYD